jgi:hypothetical protein
MAKRVFHYSGDVSIEHGGFYYALDTWAEGYVDVLEVTPCSAAGGPDNCFWLNAKTVNIPWVGGTEKVDMEEIQPALDCIGYDNAEMKADFAKRTEAERRHIITYALLSYGSHVDQNESVMIQIGPPDKFYGGREKFNPSKVLRANTSLRRYARRECNNL